MCTSTGYDVEYDAAAHTATGACLGVDGRDPGRARPGGHDPHQRRQFTATAGRSPTRPATTPTPPAASLTSIAQAGSTVSVDCSAAAETYNGLAHDVCTASWASTGADAEGGSLTVGYDDNVNAGPVTASATFAAISTTPATATPTRSPIAQAGSTVSVDCSAAAETYNGLAHDVCTASWASTGADAEGGSLTVGYDDNVNAGPVTASATFAGDLNHTGNSDTDTFTIAQAGSTVSVDCSAAAETYDGLAHDVCTASWASTGADGEGGSLTVGYDDNVNAGPVTASATFAGDLNHTGNSDTDTFTIAQAGSTVSVDCSAAAETYNGLAHDVCTASWASTGADAEGGSLTVGYDDNVNAGPVTASATFAGDLNHTGNSDTDTFTIAQRNVTGAFTAADKVWDKHDRSNGFVKATVVGALVGDDVELIGGTADIRQQHGRDVDRHLDRCRPDRIRRRELPLDVGRDDDRNDLDGVPHPRVRSHPVDMTRSGHPYLNSVKNGQTVPLKFRVLVNLIAGRGDHVHGRHQCRGPETLTSCTSGVVDLDVLPEHLDSRYGLPLYGRSVHLQLGVPEEREQVLPRLCPNR